MTLATNNEINMPYQAGANRVEFKSEDANIVGTLFLPSSYKAGDKLPAIIVEGPWTQVKEQIGYLYGGKLAENGFAALAFDSRFWGESGGEPRFFESPQAKVQDLKNAVSFLQTAEAVDRDKIGGLGVCFGASYMALLAAEDNRLKSLATVAAWLHDPESIKNLYGAEGYEKKMQAGEAARQKFAESKETVYVPAYSASDDRAAMYLPYPNMDYYGKPERGAVPAWTNQFAEMSWIDWLCVDSVNAVAPKINIPSLFVHSDNAALPDNVKLLHSKLTAPKTLHWTDGNHFDFYDQEKQVDEAVQVVIKHFQATLSGSSVAKSEANS